MKLLTFYRKCVRCGRHKPMEAYYKHPTGVLGIMRKCRECILKIRKVHNPIRAMRVKELRHRLGITKQYWNDLYPPSKRGQRKRLARKQYKARVKGGGKLSIETIQQVYEDNIKYYGTLTCIYCLNPILFGNDTLEHKQPLSRGGTNERNNLAVACQRCNCRKHNKTSAEFMAEKEK